MGNNGSTLASQLPYSRTTSTQPSQGYAYPPLQQHVGQGSASGYPSSGGGTDGIENGNSGSPAAGSGGSPVVCPLQSTVTFTTQYTTTVTQAAAAATTAGIANPSQNASTVNSSTGPDSQIQSGSGNASNGSGNPLENGVYANGSIGPKCTACCKANASGPATASASAGTGGLYGNGTLQNSKYPATANASSPLNSGTSTNSTGSLAGYGMNSTTNQTSEVNLHGEFWAGSVRLFGLLNTHLGPHLKPRDTSWSSYSEIVSQDSRNFLTKRR